MTVRLPKLGRHYLSFSTDRHGIVVLDIRETGRLGDSASFLLRSWRLVWH